MHVRAGRNSVSTFHKIGGGVQRNVSEEQHPLGICLKVFFSVNEKQVGAELSILFCWNNNNNKNRMLLWVVGVFCCCCFGRWGGGGCAVCLGNDWMASPPISLSSLM